ncbi:putative RNA methyltransferase [Actinomadura sp. HBU206391]|uniref:putative RNA methyltransferase n=1 Tax=Actinomadura sp. HBU206391 TaxID=2731692 RepID=UPI0016504E39|nr:methyltransferase domain-containing protein [Actinomadura sp. HBU206391]MBC6463568.1 methyltransferase domain-containing protein [Actinomadura sp. HBU206391]
MLSDIARDLLCPVCGAGLDEEGGALRCGAGHAFDIARQGYVNLLPGDARPGTADTPEMARSRDAFLGAGHFDPLMRSLADRVHEVLAAATGSAPATGSRVLDAGAGTGHYLAAVLDRTPGTTGIALDLSKHALRRAARAHPRIGAVAWDVWRRLPLRDGSVTAVLNVFAPRNGPEFRRVLGEGGALFVVTPTARHLGTLVGPLGLLSVDQRKAERIGAALDADFLLESQEGHDIQMSLSHTEVETLVGMGPSAWHVPTEALRERLSPLPTPLSVPASFTLSVFRPRVEKST